MNAVVFILMNNCFAIRDIDAVVITMVQAFAWGPLVVCSLRGRGEGINQDVIF